MRTFAPHGIDFYKADHKSQYPEKTESVYSNFTPRSAKWAEHLVLPDYDNKVVLLGLQGYILDKLIKNWNESFFNQPIDKVLNRYKRRMDTSLGEDAINTQHIRDLHEKGYLPLEIKALPEGSRVDIRVPMFTVKETNPEYFWLTNYIESSISCNVWKPCTTATIAYEYKRLLLKYAELTGADETFVDLQGHDFSYRGMSCDEDAANSGMGHLSSFIGTDSILAIDRIEDVYGEEGAVGLSVPATEHSVMCMGSKEGEKETFKRLITDIYPTGIVSIVSDTWDFWHVITETAKELKNEILNRQPNQLGLAKVVFRPDSGDPADIICGTVGEIPDLSDNADSVDELHDWVSDTLSDKAIESADFGEPGALKVSMVVSWKGDYYELSAEPFWNRHDKTYYFFDGLENKETKKVELTNEQKGAVQCLWELFGGTTTDKGYKVLNERVGLIYGDSITIERAQDIMRRLEAKGFASTNVVLGIGSFTYQHLTRDTFGFAMKATHGYVDGDAREIFKDPITDSGIKKSAKGLIRVEREGDKFVLYDQQTEEQESQGELVTVFKNGICTKYYTWPEVRSNIVNT